MNKTLGAHDKCFCGEPVVCVEKEYQGAKRLSWINESNSESHYSRNDDGTFNCNTTIIEDPKNKRIDTSGSGSPTPTVQQQTASSTVGTPQNSIALDFEKIYRSGIPIAERIATEAILFGQPQTPHDVSVVVQCIMKAYIQYYIAMDAAARRR